MLAIIAPLQDEIKHLRALLEVDTTIYLRPGTIWHGRIAGQEVCLARSGMGDRAMGETARYCFETYRPNRALMIGFCGGTNPMLAEGNLVLAKSVVSNEAQYTASAESLALCEAACVRTALAHHTGNIIVQDIIANYAHEKAYLGTKFDALAVSMEGMKFAQEAEAANISWSVARAVSDSMDWNPPPNFAPLASNGTIDAFKVASYLLRNPKAFLKLPHYYFASTKASKRLTEFAKAWMNE